MRGGWLVKKREKPSESIDLVSDLLCDLDAFCSVLLFASSDSAAAAESPKINSSANSFLSP
jgi:hypothetical protein